MAQKLLRLRQIIGDRKKGIEGRINISKSQFYSLIKAGRLPKPIKFGPRTSVLPDDVIQAAIDGAGRGVDIRNIVEGIQP